MLQNKTKEEAIQEIKDCCEDIREWTNRGVGLNEKLTILLTEYVVMYNIKNFPELVSTFMDEGSVLKEIETHTDYYFLLCRGNFFNKKNGEE